MSEEPSDEYITRWMNASNRRESAYWGLVFFLHELFVEAPRALQDELVTGARWTTGLLLGRLPGREENCRMKGCDSESVALLPDDKSYSDGTPVCRRHFLAVKGVVYGVLAFLAGLVSVSLFMVVFA